jgi:hypothetical protein
VPPRGTDGRGRQGEADGDGHIEQQRGEYGDAQDFRAACLQSLQPVVQEDGAGGVEHGICGSKVVTAALGDEEKRERDEVHPGQHAKATVIFEEEIIEPGEREGKCEKDQFHLVGQKAGGLAFADVAFMDESQKIQRDEMVAGLPKEIGEKEENGDGHAQPEPFAAQVATRIREQHGADNTEGEEAHGVLGKHAEP